MGLPFYPKGYKKSRGRTYAATYEQIANEFGFSGERARQILDGVLAKFAEKYLLDKGEAITPESVDNLSHDEKFIGIVMTNLLAYDKFINGLTKQAKEEGWDLGAMEKSTEGEEDSPEFGDTLKKLKIGESEKKDTRLQRLTEIAQLDED